MIYLQSFQMAPQKAEEEFFTWNQRVKMTCYATEYPFGLFCYRQLPEFVFNDITIFCGNNGSGKSTILNVIAEKLSLERSAPFNRSPFFDDYVEMTRLRLENPIPKESKIITSDGVFERVLDIRRLNDGIDCKRVDLIDEYIAENSPNAAPNLLQGIGGNGFAICEINAIRNRAF